jgi:hypothetical protein
MEGTFSMPASHATLSLDELEPCFDDTHAIASAGLLLPATLAERLASARPPTSWSAWTARPAPTRAPSC